MSYRIEDYLEDVGRCRNSSFGQRFRSQFRDMRGSAELAMLASPNESEYRDFCEAVNAMTADEKLNASQLSDEQITEIAERSQADCGNVNIFFNGYALEVKNRTIKKSK